MIRPLGASDAPDDGRPSACAVCGRRGPAETVVPVSAIRPSLVALIRLDLADLPSEAGICRADLARYTLRQLEQMLRDDEGRLGPLEAEVLDSIASGVPLSPDMLEATDPPPTFGARMADRVSAFGGSWGFLIGFALVVLVWMIVNVAGLLAGPFDPYPFILLNLVLSCLAAIQAPIIMMSQRRQETKDRQRAESDYRINLKAELEIRALNEKLDHLRDQIALLDRAPPDSAPSESAAAADPPRRGEPDAAP
jgi:uncharacterized membrane protein